MSIPINEIERLLSKLIDDANALIMYLAVDANVLLCNKKIEEITGKSRKDIVGKDWLGVLCKDATLASKQRMFKAVIDDCIAYKRPNNFEGVIIDTNNNERLITWCITPILSDTQALEGVLCIGGDVTETKEREVSLKKIDETLKNIFSSITGYALYVANLDGNITYYGMGSEKMFGWQKNEIIFKHLSILHPEDAKNELNLLLERVRNAGQHESELTLVKKGGERLPVVLSASQFLDAHGSHMGYIFIAKDITERKELEYQIFQAEKLTALGKLAAGMAHEINNPLFVISGRLEMLLEDEKLNKKIREQLTIVNAQTDRIRKLVEQLLKFARKTPPKLETLNINEVIESVLPLLSYHKLPAYNIELKKDFAPDIPLIKGDTHQLQEVFVNLFINAYQSMAEAGTLSVKTMNLNNQFAQVIVSDTGQGIAQEDLKNLFMPFFSTKKDGTGLGLSICYNIIKTHNGTIEVESQPNKGTTFTIKFPIA